MKKNVIALLIAFLPFSFNLFAQKQSPSAVLGDWEAINNSITQQLNNTFENTDNYRGLRKDDFEDWGSECKSKVGQFRAMLRKPGKKYNYDVETWKELNDKVYEAIKTGEFPGLNNSEKIEEWKSKCDLFYNAFNDLKKGSVTSPKGNNSNRNSDDPRSVIEGSNPSPNWAFPNSTNRMKKLQSENQKIKTSAEKAFDVCLFLPLAVIYDKDYVECGLAAAEGLYNAGAITKPDMKADWKAFSPLLKSYGTYNNEIIRILKGHENKLKRKKWHITEQLLSEFRDDVYESKYGKFYNDENVSIIYLDKVLNEYFDILEEKVETQEPISDRFYNNFIHVKLDPNYQR